MKYSLALAISMAGISTAVTAQTERDLDSHEHGAASLNVALDDGAVFLELETPWNNLVGFEHAPSTDEQKALVAEAMKVLVEQPERVFSLNGGDCTANKITVESGMDLEAESGHDHDDDGHHDDDKHHDDEAHHDDDKHDDHAHHDDDDKHNDDAHHDDDKHDDDAHHDDKHNDDAHHDDDKHDDDAHHDDDKHDDDAHHDDDKHDDDAHHDDDKHNDDAHHDDDKHDDDAHHDDDKHDDDAHHDDDKHDDDAHHDDDEHGHDHDEHEGETHSSALVSYSYTCGDVGKLDSISVNVFSLWPGFEALDVQLIGPAGQTGVELNAEQTSIDTTSVQ